MGLEARIRQRFTRFLMIPWRSNSSAKDKMASEPPSSKASMASNIKSICNLVLAGHTWPAIAGSGRVSKIIGVPWAFGLFKDGILAETFILKNTLCVSNKVIDINLLWLIAGAIWQFNYIHYDL
jgi:hypothetical protein